MELVCDKAPVQNAVSALHDTCMREGAMLHDSLRMAVGPEDAIWLESDLPTDSREMLVSLPASCLPSLDDFRLHLMGDEIRIADQLAGASEAQAECLSQMLAIYNATGKLAAHRAASPWHTLHDAPEVLATLAAARRGAPRIEYLHKRATEGADDDFVLESFLGTRKYAGPKNKSNGKSSDILLPFIDYANHHSHAPGFQPQESLNHAEHIIGLANARPLHNNPEVRVRYGQIDPLDSYLTYDFVDTTSDILRSVPLTIELEVGTIEILARIGRGAGKQQKLPQQMNDLRPFMPIIQERDEARLSLSHLLVPEMKRPMILRRVLNWSIRQLDPHIKLDRLRAEVTEAEAQVLAANRAFYDDLKDKSASLTAEAPRTALTTLIETQKGHLDAYSDRLAEMFESV